MSDAALEAVPGPAPPQPPLGVADAVAAMLAICFRRLMAEIKEPPDTAEMIAVFE